MVLSFFSQLVRLSLVPFSPSLRPIVSKEQRPVSGPQLEAVRPPQLVFEPSMLRFSFDTCIWLGASARMHPAGETECNIEFPQLHIQGQDSTMDRECCAALQALIAARV